ncbi:bifunctional 3-deoxy-7-phosphoheptulonate synthase/chorismate mutase type II [Balneicella halophila]|uniref:bifunctional 3-deoxy-7-phosphoheptulonate synthase/chorismate mutase type II n=1 Tax=Balneicella halophila TaxID=1537566 RepID=UPI0014042261|nr:bifunctional 3-deoxy-7-phosphoheptulonate synthase/chorismate mutase type II [Balneicella halophila]
MELDLMPFTLSGLDTERPIVIAGPCSAESEEQVLKTAKKLQKQDVQIFRAGIWKPRTRPNSFEGVGKKGLAWLQTVKKELGMYTSTEVANSQHVEDALKHDIDILWIGARTTVNPFAVQEIADALKGVDIPIMIKNPINPDINLWIGAIERINQTGIKRIVAIHRGFNVYNKSLYRNNPKWHIPIELRLQIRDIPLFCDPSHIGGKRELISPISQQALDLNFDGLMIESHIDPDNALSDASQQITPETLGSILSDLILRDEKVTTEDLADLRKQIDELDDTILEILSERMQIASQIGQYKKEHNVTIFQADRFDEILTKRIRQAIDLGLTEKFVKTIFTNVHEESIRHQNKTMNK